jgi:hypothetical protein
VSNDETTITSVSMSTISLSPEAAWASESWGTCGDEVDGSTIVCTQDQGPLEEGDYWLFETTYADDIKSNVDCDDGEVMCDQYQYGLVFDREGVRNYDSERYPNDFFNGTDAWLVLNNSVWGPALVATDASEEIFQLFPGRFRVYIKGQTISWLIPADPALDGVIGARTSVFRYLGDFGFQDEWAGSVTPEVGQPLIPLKFTF